MENKLQKKFLGKSKDIKNLGDQQQDPNYPAEPLIISNPKESNTSRNPCVRFTSATASSAPGEMAIPLPFTDSIENPVSICLPYKSRFLFSLTSRHSNHVLVNYYVTSIKCLKYLNATDTDVKDFHSNLMSWLARYVIPNLFTDTFYPGFGGVFQIVQTLKDNGVEQAQIDNYKAALEEQDNYVDEYVVFIEL
ncbi:hypothetical protein RN001_011773 [Aquatica leii]|uniref:Uncharacterized protein n=1 Tax=Aquatica leii TaxID=1421715 RepID=A0AAN7P4V6_9COLE|nr:hypothetical protein RN001_011773 [Aquatica leii]